ncbi:glycosyltransferase [Acidisoma cellulosilyticum]|nr:glycosyltransferase [Acidisoma cellulosilyticum]
MVEYTEPRASLTALEWDLSLAVFSPTFYRVMLGDEAGASTGQLFRHFVTFGLEEALPPSPLFDPLIYEHRSRLAGHSFAPSETPCFFHWLKYGRVRLIVPCAFFDEAFYQSANPDVAAAGVFGYVHFLLLGMRESRAPNASFDVSAAAARLVAAKGNCWNLVDAHVQLENLAPDLAYLLPRVFEETAAEKDQHSNGESSTLRWRSNLAGAPNALDDPFGKYFTAIPPDGNIITAWAKLRPSPWPRPEQIEAYTAQVAACELFDAEYYRRHAGLEDQTLDLALHYLLIGEALGLSPSAGFNPRYYAQRYPDLARAGLSLLLHFANHGRAEGRRATMTSTSNVNPPCFNSARENVVIVVHEGSRTGAPILGWNIAKHLAEQYNVFTVILGKGELIKDFEALSAETFGPFELDQREELDLETGLQPLFNGRVFRYAILNSSETRRLVNIFARQFVPTLFLVHEFGSYIQFAAELRSAFDHASEVVFPAEIVARSAEKLHSPLADRRIRVLPQGMSIVPPGRPSTKPKPLVNLKGLVDARKAGAFIVLGAGSVIFRKGVDFFLAAAGTAQRNQTNRPIHFLWVGHGYDPIKDLGYSSYLEEQLQRAGLEHHVTFLNEVTDLEPIYALADAFFLSSRLDPLPNVSIDAACRGIPIFCFDNASGMAELLLKDPQTAVGVVPYADAAAAGSLIARLADDDGARQVMSQTTLAFARRVFDMGRYVDQLANLAENHLSNAAQFFADYETIIADEAFDADFFLGARPIIETRAATVRRYLANASDAVALLDESGLDSVSEVEQKIPATLPYPRRPAPGFDPNKWIAAHPDRLRKSADPFAEFIRSGHPEGPWQTPVLRPFASRADTPNPAMRTLLCAHIFEIALGIDMLSHLALNNANFDLYLETEFELDAQHLRRAIGRFKNGKARVEVVTNKFSSLFSRLSSIAADYEVIGLLTTDFRTTHAGWREFQWQTLLGGRHAMVDRILSAFNEAPALGAVFSADPYLRPDVEADGIVEDMFWTRSVIMRNLSALVLQAAAPAGSGMLPAACAHAGLFYSIATVPCILW